MKRLLRRIPGLVRVYRHARLLGEIAYERWADPRKVYDSAHLNKEWNFEAPAERARYARTVAAVSAWRGPAGWGDVLEVGCAEGMFTLELARRARSVTAIDVSPVACARTAERCASYPNVRVDRLDIQRDAIPGCYDLVFTLDVLEYVHGRNRLAGVVTKLEDALRPGGLLIFSETRLPDDLRNAWWVRWLPEGGDALVPFIQSCGGFRLLAEEKDREDLAQEPRYCSHVVAIFEKSREESIVDGDERG